MIYKTAKRLLQSRGQILKGFGSTAPTDYDVSAWRKHFGGDSDFEQILQEFPISIRRSDMECLSRQVRDGSYAQIRKLYTILCPLIADGLQLSLNCGKLWT